MKKVIILLITGTLLLAACKGHFARKGIYVKKSSKKCGTCPVW